MLYMDKETNALTEDKKVATYWHDDLHHEVGILIWSDFEDCYDERMIWEL